MLRQKADPELLKRIIDLVVAHDKAKYGSRNKPNHNRLKKYGLTVQSYSQLLDQQKNVCGICKKSPPAGKVLVIDHDHLTGAIRGLLCTSCNMMLGNCKDDILILCAGIKYLVLTKLGQPIIHDK